MESPVVVCEECGFETKTVPKSKKCRHCGWKMFIYINAKGEDKELDFRTQEDYEDYHQSGIYGYHY